MKRLKKLLAGFMTACMLITAVPTTAMAEGSDSDSGTWGGIDWTFEVTKEDGTGKLTIAPTDNEPESVTNSNSNRKTPYEVGEWREKVKYVLDGEGNYSTVAYAALPYDPAKVIDLEIEKGVTKIGSFVAQNMPLTDDGTLVIPSTVTYIGTETFAGSKVKKLIFAEGGTEELCIAAGAFKRLDIEEVVLPDDRPVHMHAWVFLGCTNLKEVTLPANVTIAPGTQHTDYWVEAKGDENVHSDNKYDCSIFADDVNLEVINFGSEEVRDQLLNAFNLRFPIEAFVGLTAYGDLQDALDAAKEGEVVKLVKSKVNFNDTSYKPIVISEGETIVIPAGVTLDTNGTTLTNNGTIVCNGGVIIGNVEGNITGPVTRVTSGTVTEDAKTVVTGPADVKMTDENETVVTISDDGQSEVLVNADGTVTVNAGNEVTVKDATTTTTIKVEEGSATVNYDGSVTVAEDGVVIVNGETIEFPYGGTINADGTVTQNPEPTPEPTPSTTKKSTKKYSVSVDADEIENGVIKLSPSKAKKGATVTLTVIPDEGYKLDKLVVLDKDGDAVELTDKGNGKFTFKMPRGGVEVDASFVPEDSVVKEDRTLVLTIGQPVYTVDGQPAVNDVAPIVKADRTFLPIRLIAEFLGATVAWNEAEQAVTIVNGDTTIVIYIGQAFATVNGNPVQLDAPAFIANDRTYLPVRFIAENLGAEVIWDGTAQTVTIIG